MVNILQLKLQNGITLAILTFRTLFPTKHAVPELRCGENLNEIGQELLGVYKSKESIGIRSTLINEQLSGQKNRVSTLPR